MVLAYRCAALSMIALLFTWTWVPQHTTDALNVLTMGDSLDRHSITAYCTEKRAEGVNILADYEWGKGRSKYGNAQEPYTHPSYWMCRTHANTSIAHSHFFGSRPTGPYYNNIRWYKYPHSDLVHSVTRMNITYEMYTEMFGHPDKIMLSFAIWDLQQLMMAEEPDGVFPRKGTKFWMNAVHEYANNLRDRAIQALQLASTSNLTHGTSVWLRTSPNNILLNALLDEFNSITRGVAADLGLGLFDEDKFLYDEIGYDYSKFLKQLKEEWNSPPEELSEAQYIKPMFQDKIHVWLPYGAACATAVMEETYTKFLTWPDPAKSRLHLKSGPGDYHACPLLYSCTSACMDAYKGDMAKTCECIINGTISGDARNATHVFLEPCIAGCSGSIVDKVKSYVQGGCLASDTSLADVLPNLRMPPEQLPDGNNVKSGMYGGHAVATNRPLYKYGIKVQLIALAGVNITSHHDVAEHAFLMDTQNHVRHAGMTLLLLRTMKLGLGDVYRVSEAELKAIPAGRKLPNFDKCHLIQTMLEQGSHADSTADNAYKITYFRHYRDMRFRRIWSQDVLERLEGLLTPAPSLPLPSQVRRRARRRLHASTDTGHHHEDNHFSCSRFPNWIIDKMPYGAFYWDGSFPGPTPWLNVQVDPGTGDRFAQDEQYTFFDWLPTVPANKLFKNNSQIILKIHGMHQVYKLQHGHRAPINSVDEMVALGRDWDDILVVTVNVMELICQIFTCYQTKDGL